MLLLRPILLRRLGFWALLQALPSESALKAYLKSVFLALCSAVIGSILLGALIAAGMIVLYQVMLMNGVDPMIAGLATAGAGIALLIVCAAMFVCALRRIVDIQRDAGEKTREQAVMTPASRLINALRDGFSSGYK
jgi:hypothetical protein